MLTGGNSTLFSLSGAPLSLKPLRSFLFQGSLKQLSALDHIFRKVNLQDQPESLTKTERAPFNSAAPDVTFVTFLPFLLNLPR